MLGHILPPDLFPYRLRIDQNPVQIEDDRCHHSPILPAPIWTGQTDPATSRNSASEVLHGGRQNQADGTEISDTGNTGHARLR
jgi:hypothetical protein